MANRSTLAPFVIAAALLPTTLACEGEWEASPVGPPEELVEQPATTNATPEVPDFESAYRIIDRPGEPGEGVVLPGARASAEPYIIYIYWSNGQNFELKGLDPCGTHGTPPPVQCNFGGGDCKRAVQNL